LLSASGGEAEGGLGGEAHEVLECAGGFLADASLEVMAEADEAEDHGGLGEIEMVDAAGVEEAVEAEGECGGGTEGDQGVHIGLADEELLPCAPVEAPAAEGLDGEYGGEAEPAEPSVHRGCRVYSMAMRGMETPRAKRTLKRQPAPGGDLFPGSSLTGTAV